MIWAFDADSANKPGLNFYTARAQGFTHCYVKLGGNNMAGNRPYRMNGYTDFVNRAIAAGLVVGNYWVTGGGDTVGAANFYLANRDPRTSFDVLDNEHLDSGRTWSDGEAATFFDVLASAGLSDLWHYGSRDALWNAGGSWPYLQQRKIKALVALYNGSPFVNVNPRTYPSALVKGHQYTSSASIGGIGLVDADAFTSDAFSAPKAPPTSKGDVVYVYGNQKNPNAPVANTPYVYQVWPSPFDGTPQMRLLGVYEGACVLATPGLAVFADDATITGLAKEANYRGPLPGLAFSDDVIGKLAAQIQPVSADEVAQKTAALVKPSIESIRVPKSGTIQLS
jgi:hypothetical protein